MYVSLDEIRGVFPAMVTPVDRTGAVDETAVNALVEYFIAAGVNGLYVLGTTGESPLLTRAQKEAMVAAVLKLSLIHIYWPTARWSTGTSR